MCRDACTLDSAGNETSLGTVRVRGGCDLDIHVHRVLLDVVVVSSRLSTGSRRWLPRVRPCRRIEVPVRPFADGRERQLRSNVRVANETVKARVQNWTAPGNMGA